MERDFAGGKNSAQEHHSSNDLAFDETSLSEVMVAMTVQLTAELLLVSVTSALTTWVGVIIISHDHNVAQLIVDVSVSVIDNQQWKCCCHSGLHHQ